MNLKNGEFATVSSVSGLDSADDGRAVAVSDWDQDGNSDLWISSRTAPRIRFFRNNGAATNNYIAFHLRGTRCNRDAIGARLDLSLGPNGETRRIKSLQAGEGFLSQSSKWISFGIGNESKIERLVVRWPDGDVEEFSNLHPNTRYTIQQGRGKAERWLRPKADSKLAASEPQLPPTSQVARVVTLTTPRLPFLEYVNVEGKTASVLEQPSATDLPRRGILVNLWTNSCVACLQELKQFTENEQAIRKRGLDIVALNIDQVLSADESQSDAAPLQLPDFPFRMGIANESIVRGLDTLHQSLIDLQTDLPVPCSFLITNNGALAVLYKGPVEIAQLIDDADILSANQTQLRDFAAAFSGTWITKPIASYPQDIALKFIEQGKTGEGIKYLESFLESLERSETNETTADIADIHFLLGRLRTDVGDIANGQLAYEAAIRENPDYRKARINLADLLLKRKKPVAALGHLKAALELQPNDPATLVAQGVALAALRNSQAAGESYKKALRLQPGHRQARVNLARLLHAQGKTAEAISHYRIFLENAPDVASDANNLAWILATSSNPSQRNGVEAVRWAEQACRLTDHQEPRFLTTLAAAYSEARRFKDAIFTANTAIRTAYAAGKPKIAASVEKHLRFYEAGKSYHEGRRQ